MSDVSTPSLTKKLTITYTKSVIGYTQRQVGTLRALGQSDEKKR